MTVCQPLEAR